MASLFAKGQRFESLVAVYLTRVGYFLVARNVITPYGEIDLILWKNLYIFIEVKTSSKTSDVFTKISMKKLEHIQLSVEYYCTLNDISDYRVDYVCVVLQGKNELFVVEKNI